MTYSKPTITSATGPSTTSANIIALDQDGHLCDHTIWTPDVAQQLADTLDVNLSSEHLEVLQQVRIFFTKFNHAPATRPLIKWLQQTLPEQDISNQKLQQLFNTGLVARHVNRLAGLPKPPNCL
ncbi:TusE/DsrC/DsvC family sulfur relay protein [Psychrobacter urativorans]|uniref:TusE/DsrC/DsvC family sulfur relay protein n=1 Tax=Psychrobacter urativorans TaxID=45610 RepID=UPI00191848BB|nr:TusE/DsrC/DsvC family sulfur relay protein [Psychrobacter urativorans]